MSSTRSPTPTRSIPSGALPIILAQFDQPHASGEHWTLKVVESPECIHTFEIRGNRDSYTYIHDRMKHLDRVESYRGGCHVGNVPRDKVSEMRMKLKEVNINKHDPRWNPQVWVLDAIKVLKDEGWAFSGVNEAFMRGELQNDMVRWDLVEDTVYERVLQELDSGRLASPTTVTLPAEDGPPNSSTAPTVNLTNACLQT